MLAPWIFGAVALKESTFPNGATARVKRSNHMGQKQIDVQSGGVGAVAAQLAAGSGTGFGWGDWLTAANNAISIGLAGLIALLTNNMLRKVIK